MSIEKLKEVLTHPSDGAVAIVTQGINEPHVVNTWNSYINITNDGKLLIPVGGMNETENNIARNNKVKLTVANREVQGKMYKGTGFLIKGTAGFLKEGSEFELMKTKFPWARAVLEITIESADQTL
ncbi:FMN-binding protein [Desulfosporosinus acididurans]|uniref:FMN-binding protein n=1 Tax=Desulfosporosinus acididurans TaxID=476652 RepID=A0A0J1FJI7_9FIRM|nr:pyridoxamine 5'-phosphate oxidase family protein [Desulfosporosinus acididurans]KLU63634.1 FMN-binding protein [Desulfosporosinus acididurans]